ncbi:MAG: biotin--[acetyl-CoA-carboxylase] ligase [Moraxella sp.]|nr:biotin--[acetyl-CoA-carboxylase] ligase [Moraxella sp.]
MSDFLTATAHTHFDTIDSTNTQLIRAIADGTYPHTTPHLYTASHQTAGRGQHGRTWVSGVDNVFLSLYVPIGHGVYEPHALSGMLSLTVGYELANLPIMQTINAHRQTDNLPPIGVKWANDVGVYDDKAGFFKKLAGILIEPVFKTLDKNTPDKNTLVGMVIGVGLNVGHSPVIKDGLYQTTCLKELSDIKTTAQDLYIPMANAIFQAVQTCNHLKNEINIRQFIIDFNKNHILQGKNIHIFIQNNMTDVYAKGKCLGIGNQGELLLNDNGDIQPIFAGMAKIISH